MSNKCTESESQKQVEQTSNVSNGKLEDFNWDIKVGNVLTIEKLFVVSLLQA